MAPLSLALVAPPDELPEMQQALQSLIKRFPFKLVTGTQAVEGASALQKIHQQTGKVDAAILHARFSAPGKETYSEVLHKALKNKFSGTTIVAYGKEKKAGVRGKHFTEFVDGSDGIDTKALAEVLAKLSGGSGGKDAQGKKPAKRNSGEADRNAKMDRKGSSRSHLNKSFSSPGMNGFPMSPRSPGPLQPLTPGSSNISGFSTIPLSTVPRHASFTPPGGSGQFGTMNLGMQQGPPLMPHASGTLGSGPLQMTNQSVQATLGRGPMPGSPGAGLMPQMSGFQSSLDPHASSMFNQMSGVFNASVGVQAGGAMSPRGAVTPTGVRTPTGDSYGQQLVGSGSPNAELIKHLSQELERLKVLVLEKKARESSARAAVEEPRDGGAGLPSQEHMPPAQSQIAL